MSAYKESFNDLYVSREHFYMVTARVFFKNPEIPSLCKFLLWTQLLLYSFLMARNSWKLTMIPISTLCVVCHINNGKFMKIVNI